MLLGRKDVNLCYRIETKSTTSRLDSDDICVERTLTKSALPTSFWMEEHYYVFKRQCRRVYSAILSRSNFSPVTFKKTGRIMSCYVNVVTLNGNESSC